MIDWTQTFDPTVCNSFDISQELLIGLKSTFGPYLAAPYKIKLFYFD